MTDADVVRFVLTRVSALIGGHLRHAAYVTLACPDLSAYRALMDCADSIDQALTDWSASVDRDVANRPPRAGPPA